MSGISIEITPGLTQDTTHVQHSGEQPLGITLGAGGVVAAMDEWLSQHKDFEPYEWRWDPNIGALPGVAKPISTHTELNLQPEAFGDRIWDNSKAAAPTKFSVSLHKDVTLTTETSWSTKLTIGDSFTANVGVSGGPIKAGASNTVSVQAEVGKTTSKTTTVTLGTSDGSESELPPGVAELVVLTALSGDLQVFTQIQTSWEGHWLWRHRNSGENWRQFPATNVLDHGLARPWDAKGIHSGLMTLESKFGAAGEVRQQVESLADTSPTSVKNAIADALQSYGFGTSTIVGYSVG